MMSKVTYPRPCPHCSKLLNNRFGYCRHKAYCSKSTPEVQCLYCDKSFTRLDNCRNHIKKFHSEAAKRKAGESAELLRLGIMNSDKVPRLDIEKQVGGAVKTRGKKRVADDGDSKPEVKLLKAEEKEEETPGNDDDKEYEGGRDALYVADFKKLSPAKRWKKNALVNKKFILTLDQQRGPKEDEDLHVGATHAIAVGIDKLVEDLKIPDEYWMTQQIGSREHRREGLTGKSWKLPVGDFTGRAAYTQALLQKLSNVLNSGEFITNDVGFSTSVLFSRPETKGSKRAGGGPDQTIWDQMAKESRCVCEIKNKDTLCCARATVVMREYPKRQAGEENTFENIRQDRGKNSQQLKQAKKLYEEAGVSEGPCGLEEIEQFQYYLGPQGYKIIVVEAARAGVIFKGDAFQEAEKIIALVKSQYQDKNGDLKGHYGGLYSIPAFMNRSYFCDRCCKGYNTGDSAHHNCQAQNCPACKQSTSIGEDPCSDFTFWSKPDRSCKICKREFYGETCFANHLIQYETVDKELKKMKEELEQNLDEELPNMNFPTL